MISTILRRAIAFLNLIANPSLTNPQSHRFVIFEDVNTDYIIPLLRGENVFIIPFPLKKIYITPLILFRTFKNIFQGHDFITCYLRALISILNPDIVITFIDNSSRFHALARSDHQNRRYLAIQNAARYDLLEPRKSRKPFFHSELACFGKYDEILHEKASSSVQKYYHVGSLREAYFRRYQRLNNRPILPEKKFYDLCVVAEASPGWDREFPGFELAVGRVAQFALRFAKEKKLNIVIAGKRDIYPAQRRHKKHSFDDERLWYEQYIGKSVEITPRVRDEYSTYQLISQSRLSIASVSTALFEGASRGSRVLFCNFTGNNIWNFPGGGINALNVNDETYMYSKFKERVCMLLDMSENDYQLATQKTIDNIISRNVEIDTIRKIENIIFSTDLTNALKNNGASDEFNFTLDS